MKGVVPAAGRGTRLRPLTDGRPKGLVEVRGKPLLTYCFEELLSLGVEELVVVVGYMGEEIRDHYGPSFDGVPVTYARQRERLGVAHALLQAEPHVGDDFLLMNGDNVFRANLDEVVARKRETGAAVVCLAEDVSREEATRTGVFETEGDRIVGMVEKSDDPPSTLAAAGFYALSPEVFHACHLVRPSARGEYELSDAVDVLLYAGADVEAVPLDGWRVNVNTPDDLKRAERRLAESGCR